MCLVQRARAAALPPKARTRPPLSAAATLPHQKPPTLSLDRLFLVVRLTVAVVGGVSAIVALSLNHHQSIIIAASKRQQKNKQVFAHHHPHVCVLRGASPSEAPGNIYCLCVCVRVGSSWRFVCVRVCSGCSVGTLVGARLKIINVCVFIYICACSARVHAVLFLCSTKNKSKLPNAEWGQCVCSKCSVFASTPLNYALAKPGKKRQRRRGCRLGRRLCRQRRRGRRRRRV